MSLVFSSNQERPFTFSGEAHLTISINTFARSRRSRVMMFSHEQSSGFPSNSKCSKPFKWSRSDGTSCNRLLVKSSELTLVGKCVRESVCILLLAKLRCTNFLALCKNLLRFAIPLVDKSSVTTSVSLSSSWDSLVMLLWERSRMLIL